MSAEELSIMDNNEELFNAFSPIEVMDAGMVSVLALSPFSELSPRIEIDENNSKLRLVKAVVP